MLFTSASVLAEPTPEDIPPLDCVINPSEVADLGSGVPGVISTVTVDRSDFVEAGQVIAQLDSGVEQAALELARARAGLTAEVDLRRVNAAFGHRQHARAQDLFQKKVLSTNDMDERETEAKVAALQLRQALDNQILADLEQRRAEELLDRRTIRSPFTGVVMERFKTTGEYIEDQPVVRVAQLDPLHVEVIVPVEQLGKVHEGMQAEIWVDEIGDATWTASVSRVDRVADAASGTYGVRLTLPNEDFKIPAGLRCKTRFLPTPTVATAPPGEQVSPQPDSRTVAAEPRDSESTEAQRLTGPAPQTTDAAPLRRTVESFGASKESAVDVPSIACKVTGPYTDRAAAEREAKALRAQGLGVSVQAKQEGARSGYQIFSAPFASRAEALELQQKLRAAGVKDFFLMAPEGGRYVVSLGLYRGRHLAERRVADLERKGFSARMADWYKERPTYWLAVSGEGADNAAELNANGDCSKIAGK